MRSEKESTQSMCYYLSPEAMVPKDHPLRPIKAMVDAALKQLSAHFFAIYSHTGRPSILPDRRGRAHGLQSIRLPRMVNIKKILAEFATLQALRR
ncbi:hypothetical protein [Geoalkalibacter halelectricus]|uniref:hypothetical protein n=1 Tax=Geoalkalibacter halelectricus TaxID=2847045 RepID=UPI00266EB99C|nr:hypothetical protein [Geoalkalibacter halelectricus]MDO3379486.1 hypothetical protein [Geoalkalibacter halelectricus]